MAAARMWRTMTQRQRVGHDMCQKVPSCFAQPEQPAHAGMRLTFACVAATLAPSNPQKK
jgi:hypothetical protein